METMKFDLSNTALLTFEINKDCNLKNHHPQCPINKRTYINTQYALTNDVIINCIEEAKSLNFSGLIGFHYYNEPLLALDQILRIIDREPASRYLLWTNGTLLDSDVEHNGFLSRFFGVVITQYEILDPKFLEKLRKRYPNIVINPAEFDNRLHIYESSLNYGIGCKRPFLELPIDQHGNIHLCCVDWNNTYIIGNIFQTSFRQIIQGAKYQQLLSSASQQYLGAYSPDICKRCTKHLIHYLKSTYVK